MSQLLLVPLPSVHNIHEVLHKVDVPRLSSSLISFLLPVHNELDVLKPNSRLSINDERLVPMIVPHHFPIISKRCWLSRVSKFVLYTSCKRPPSIKSRRFKVK